MKLVGIRALQPNEKLSTPIKMADGRILLSAGAQITENYIERLKRIGIYSVYVDDDMYDDVKVVNAIDDETKAAALNVISKVYKQSDSSKPFDEYEVKAVVKNIVQDVKGVLGSSINLFNTYMVEDPRHIHAVNVAVISAAMALLKGYAVDMLEDTVAGAFLHDVKLKSVDEMKNAGHAQEGLEYMRLHRSISTRSYMITYAHHEHFDGSGFPRGAAGEEIYEGARLVAVADMYDRLVHGYGEKAPIMPHEAYEIMNASAWKSLDGDMLELFKDSMAIYPTGATIVLNNGEKGLVVRQNPKMPLRPVVRVITGDKQIAEYDLLEHLTLFIDKVILA